MAAEDGPGRLDRTGSAPRRAARYRTDAAIPLAPIEAGAGGYTNRLCAFAAAMKLANKGCGSNGRDFSSGWNCTPMNQG